MNKIFIIFVFILNLECLLGQDVHWSQFHWSPLQLNPALTGNFDGRWRFAGNYRDQWRAVSRPYQTLGISADARDFLNAKNLNIGCLFYHDLVGVSKYRTVQAGIPLSYRFQISRDSVHSIHLGLMPAFQRQSLDPSGLTFDDQYNGWRYDPNRPTSESITGDASNMFPIHGGVTYTHESKKGWSLIMGYSMLNINQPAFKFMLGQNSVLFRRHNYHAFAQIPLSWRWFLTPSALYSQQFNSREILAGSEVNMVLDPGRYRYRVVFLGVFSRFSDAWIGSAGFYYNSWRFGVSYDINTSPFTSATRYRGGLELSLIYILRDILPKRDNFKYCPVFL